MLRIMMLFLAGLIMLGACSDDKPATPEEKPVAISATPKPAQENGAYKRISAHLVKQQEIDKLKLGMSMTEVRKALQPAAAQGASVPTLVYPGEQGKTYCLIFYYFKNGKMIHSDLQKIVTINSDKNDSKPQLCNLSTKPKYPRTAIALTLAENFKPGQNLIWCATGQACWNTLSKNMCDNAPIYFKDLNKSQKFQAEILNSKIDNPLPFKFNTLTGFNRDENFQKARAALTKKYVKNFPEITKYDNDRFGISALAELTLKFKHVQPYDEFIEKFAGKPVKYFGINRANLNKEKRFKIRFFQVYPASKSREQILKQARDDAEEKGLPAEPEFREVEKIEAALEPKQKQSNAFILELVTDNKNIEVLIAKLDTSRYHNNLKQYLDIINYLTHPGQTLNDPKLIKQDRFLAFLSKDDLKDLGYSQKEKDLAIARIKFREKRKENQEILSDPELKIPVIDFKKLTHFTDFEGKKFDIAGDDYFTLVSFLQIIKFRLDHIGGSLESLTKAVVSFCKPDELILDEPFFILIRKRGTAEPIFFARIANTDVMIPVKMPEQVDPFKQLIKEQQADWTKEDFEFYKRFRSDYRREELDLSTELEKLNKNLEEEK